MDSGLKKLEYLSLVSKVCTELEAHIGCSEKTLAQFIIDIAQRSDTVEAFDQGLKKNGAQIPEYFVKTLLIIIHAILAPKSKAEWEQLKGLDGVKEEKKSAFAGLSVPDNRTRVKELEEELASEGVVHRDRVDGGRREGDRNGRERVEKENQGEGDQLRRNSVRDKNKGTDSDRDRERGRERESGSERDGIRFSDGVGGRADKDDRDQRYRRGRGSEHEGIKERVRLRDRDRNSDRDPVQGSARHQKDGGEKWRESDWGRDNNNDHEGRERGGHVRANGAGRTEIVGEPELFGIYNGRGSRIMDYGCFGQLQGVIDRKEGLAHVYHIASRRVANAKDAVERDQEVWVKVISIGEKKMSLSMRDVDQKTGQDVLPMK
jgi:ATP-dependent RNA helicase DHX8/PRP22